MRAAIKWARWTFAWLLALAGLVGIVAVIYAAPLFGFAILIVVLLLAILVEVARR